MISQLMLLAVELSVLQQVKLLQPMSTQTSWIVLWLPFSKVALAKMLQDTGMHFLLTLLYEAECRPVSIIYFSSVFQILVTRHSVCSHVTSCWPSQFSCAQSLQSLRFRIADTFEQIALPHLVAHQ